MEIALLIVLSMAFGGAVSSASMHGVFEGNPIVKIMTYGEELTVEGTPAINYNGRAMVPIYMLRELGVDVTWDADNETVHLAMPAMDATYDASLIAELTSHLGVTYVETGSYGDGYGHVTYHIMDSIYEVDEFAWETILQYSAYTSAEMLYVLDVDGVELSVDIELVRQYFDGTISVEQLTEGYSYYNTLEGYGDYEG
ncbi:copper amine oxidase N-terminal domain-containing protein [Paenibacillus sp. TRM 82003]|nr:copper amine oxidase N-terminal domain-containing protein [Paenibacillus sp. TRM 82003]